MHLGRCLALGAFCLSSLWAASSRAQEAPAAIGTETLETPYEDPVPVPPPPPAAPPAAPAPPAPPAAMTSPAEPGPPALESRPLPPKADTRPLGPIRARRRLGLTGEISWNGLAGFGPVLTYNVHPNFSADLGGGLSAMGWKAGLRFRYNLLTASFTPFFGLGYMMASGFGEVPLNDASDPNYDPDRDPVTIDLKASYLIQTTVGFDFLHRRGFTMIGALGYAWLMNSDNYDVLAGELADDEKQAIDALYRSGLVISLSFGYTWQ
jgi:hypothetical protein